jgi:5'-deoxynucleotidase YfbR-like HD superfamily hydrolase
MAKLEFTVTLPENVAREAEAIGLLQPEALERLFREAIRRRQQEQLFAAADRLAGLDLPALTESEVAAEIEAARSERRAGHARSG